MVEFQQFIHGADDDNTLVGQDRYTVADRVKRIQIVGDQKYRQA